MEQSSWLSFLLDPANPVPSGGDASAESSRLTSLFGSSDSSSGTTSSRFFPAMSASPTDMTASPVLLEFEHSLESVSVVEDEPCGSESDISNMFELKEWPSVERLAVEAPQWITLALRPVSQGGFVAPPPGFNPTPSDEAHAIRTALAHLMAATNPQPVVEKLAQISQGLVWAASSANFAALSAILSCRVDPNSRTQTPLEGSPLHFACLYGHLAIVDALLGAGAQINGLDRKGRTCLDWAVCGGHVSLLRRLADAGALLGQGVSDGRSGLDFAAALGNVPMVTELISLRVPLDRGDAAGRTPLHWASLYGRTAVVRRLLQSGANPDAASTRDGATALHWAVTAGHGLVVGELLTGGADPGKVDGRGQRPLDVAALFGKRDLVEMLVAGGAPALEDALVNACRAGRASNAGHVETLKSLLKLGANPNCRDDQNRTPAEIVTSTGGLPEMVAVLSGARPRVEMGLPALSSTAASASGGATGNAAVKSEETNIVINKPSKRKDDDELSNVVHIGSLPSIPGGTLWEAIKTKMSEFGTVRQVRMTPKSTFAFVEFDTVDEAVAAVTQCDGTVQVHGATCTVSWATKRKRKGRKPKNQGGAVAGEGANDNNSRPKPKKKNACHIWLERGACSFGASCKYAHEKRQP